NTATPRPTSSAISTGAEKLHSEFKQADIEPSSGKSIRARMRELCAAKIPESDVTDMNDCSGVVPALLVQPLENTNQL
ncbi:MAG TPA: hypothetical protein DCE49_15155, partial [Pseudomonas sp.]|nr:hypothetical protein [Pseudomonas sp.]